MGVAPLTEQRLALALHAVDNHQESFAAAIQPTALEEQALAIHAPQCLFMLTALPLQDGACRTTFVRLQNRP